MAVLSSGSGFPYFNNQIDGSGMRPQIAAVESLLGQVRLAYKPLLSVCQDGETFQHSKLLGKLDQVICLLLVKLGDITELANSLEVDGAHIVGEAGQLENETRRLLDYVHGKQNTLADTTALAELSLGSNSGRDENIENQCLQQLTLAESLLVQVNVAAVRNRFAVDPMLLNLGAAAPSISDRVTERMSYRQTSDSAVLASSSFDPRLDLKKFRP